MSSLPPGLDQGRQSGALLESSYQNILAFLEGDPTEVERASITELVAEKDWTELNNRFFRTLAFGTGGLRGRTIGLKVTAAERGTPQALDRPEHPCTGTNAMNYYNISRATQGLVAYVKEYAAAVQLPHRPRICLSYDSRHFSPEFARAAARVITDLGCDALLFESPRSTPELSFSVRETGSQAGINLTASHNPPAYNGYKVYFADGGQVVDPHASGIIAKVNAIRSARYTPLPESERGELRLLGREIDEAYLTRLQTLLLDPEVVAREKDLKIVYSPLHGVGAVIIEPLLQRLGFHVTTVPEQKVMDGRFPTVKSPNPEYAEALTMAIALAEKQGADLVLATDPDDDRMGVAARGAGGRMELLTGNQIGSMLAYYRAQKFLELGILDEANKDRGVIITTFVTTALHRVIAAHFGLRCVITLTGFKYNAAKLEKYELAIPAAKRRGYAHMSEAETRALRLAYSSLYVFGSEESYGYSGADFVRDKDANAAVLMFAELAAHAKSRGLTAPDYLDEIFCELGVHLERGESLVFEGAEGAAKITRLNESYTTRPPREIDGSPVESVLDFTNEEIRDVEGDLIPKESMLIFSLADGRRVAVRPSGTEPKIKYYMFGVAEPPAGGRFERAEIAAVKERVTASVDRLWHWMHADAEARLAT